MVDDFEADVVGGFGVFDGDEVCGFGFGGEEATVGAAVGKETGSFDEVGDYGTSRGFLAGTTPVVERVAAGVTFDSDGIEDAVDAGEDVFGGEKGRLSPDFDSTVFVTADEAEEFDDVPEFFGEVDVDGGDFFDAADVDLLVVDEGAVGEGGEEDGFVGGVPAIDVEGLVSFGVAEVFGFLEGFRVAEAGLGHALEDVVGSAVDDAGDGFDFVADKGFLDGFDNGNSSGDSGFEVDGGVVLAGEGEEFGATFGEEGFVASDDRFAGLECGGDEVEGFVGAADEFDDDVDGGVVGEGVKVGGEELGGGVGFAGFVEVADDDLPDFEGDGAVGAFGDELAVAGDDIPDTGADGAEAGKADAEGFAAAHAARVENPEGRIQTFPDRDGTEFFCGGSFCWRLEVVTICFEADSMRFVENSSR